MAFYGRAELNGSPLPAGSIVQAFADGILAGQSTVDNNGYYGEDNPTQSRLIISPYTGSELIFKYINHGQDEANVGDTVVKYLGIFESSETVEFDLPFVYNANVSVTPISSGGGGGGGGGGSGAGISVSAPAKIISTLTALTTGNAPTATGTAEVLGVKIIDYSTFTSLFGLSGELTNDISQSEAVTVTGQLSLLSLSSANKDLYKRVLGSYMNKISSSTEMAIAYFIQVGTPTTKRLGSGELAGSLSSYIAAFNQIPTTTAEWQDVVKIANGRWPSQTNQAAEDAASVKFKKVYLRTPNMKNSNDSNAVTIIAYGLRPASRNMNSEKAAIKSFKAIFGYNPSSAIDWNIVRAIAYSGAKR